MKNVFLTTTALVFVASASFAEDNTAIVTPVMSGEVALDFAETAAGDWGGTMGLDLDVNADGLASVALGFEAAQGGAVTLETWTVGTTVGGLGVALGNDNGVFVEGEDGATLLAPAMTESVKLSYGDAAVAVGFTDWTSDVTDISNVQGAYTLGLGIANVTASGDYNLDSEDWAVGGRATTEGLISNVALGGTVTYGSAKEVFAFEADATVYGVTGYLNGDTNDTLQNVGGSYSYALGGATVEGGVNYNIDSEDLTPTVGLSFAF